MTPVGLDDIGTSTTLESNKSLHILLADPRDVRAAHTCIFSSCFKKLGRSAKLATGYILNRGSDNAIFGPFHPL